MEAVWDRSRWYGISPLSHRVPSLLSVTEEKLRSLAELQQAVLQGTVSDPLVLPAAFSPDVPFCHATVFELVAVLCSRQGARRAAAVWCTW